MQSFSEFTGDWQIIIDGTEDSWWDYKGDAIERILEIIELEGEGNLDDYEYEGENITFDELKYELEDLSEEDFYTVLEEIKKECEYEGDIKLYNISDETEIDFLKDEDDFDFGDFDV